MRQAERSTSGRGFTLVELLVVLAIIGVLTGLLLPAIQASREAARVATCKNSLRQLGMAVDNHVAAFGHFPSGGWGGSWSGDPRRGFGSEQPGGWVFNTLPFLEQGNVRQVGDTVTDDDQMASAARAMQLVLSGLICPSRRDTALYPHAQPYLLVNSHTPPRVARSDYAINGGESGATQLGTGDQSGPASIAEANSGYVWPPSTSYNGVCFFRSEVERRQVLDGMSNTYLVGEKYLDTRHYGTGLTDADRGFAIIGFAPDTVRFAKLTLPPRRDAESTDPFRFGSAHPGGCYFVYCDGSVRPVSFLVDPEIHRMHGNRQDGGDSP